MDALYELAKLGVGAVAMAIAFGFVMVTFFSNRASANMTLSLVGAVGNAYKRIDGVETLIEEQGRLATERHEASIKVQNLNISALKEILQLTSDMKNEVAGVRNDNQLVRELKDQLTALQRTTQKQTEQLETQALEIATLRESNAALINNLKVERAAKVELEKKLAEELARNQEEVDLLKAQFNSLQTEFTQYKQAAKSNKEQPLKNDLPQHLEQSDSTDNQ